MNAKKKKTFFDNNKKEKRKKRLRNEKRERESIPKIDFSYFLMRRGGGEGRRLTVLKVR